MMSPLSACASTHFAQDDDALGQAAEAVIYVFPTGHALMACDAAHTTATLVEYPSHSVPLMPSPATAPNAPCPSPSQEDWAWIDRRLAAGTLTIAQLQVARYDQAVTGHSLTEALALRGWL